MSRVVFARSALAAVSAVYPGRRPLTACCNMTCTACRQAGAARSSMTGAARSSMTGAACGKTTSGPVKTYQWFNTRINKSMCTISTR